mgnify:CR=1 FL=1|tara:strand:+ start:169 stop:444 length:276 start_codon:yes stop_codon:yes gene_type:complete
MASKRSRDAIAVSAEVKRGLDEINDQMEKHLGSRLSYNEVLTYLLVQYKKSGGVVYGPPDDPADLSDHSEIVEQRSDDSPYASGYAQYEDS